MNWKTSFSKKTEVKKQNVIIPNERRYYLQEIADTVRNYHKHAEKQAELGRRLFQIEGTIAELKDRNADAEVIKSLEDLKKSIEEKLTPESKRILDGWEDLKKKYAADQFVHKVRGKELVTNLKTKTLSGLEIPKIALPKFKDYGEILRWVYKENVPGSFPFTAGVFPFKREGEDPKRQFAGEGTPERTNRRFHYLCKDDKAKRLSTAFDSVTLYGEDPITVPTFSAKSAKAGQRLHLDDMKKLYKGFDLCDPATSVSMTINGPAPILLAMFLNTAIDQQVEKKERARPQTDERRIRRSEGKNFADGPGHGPGRYFKEDQGQNTHFTTEFALKMMGDIQEYFIQNKVRNYYSVSISGYHIAEAGPTRSPSWRLRWRTDSRMWSII